MASHFNTSRSQARDAMFKRTLGKPNALRKGDRVRLVATGSPFEKADFERGISVVEKLGYLPVVGKRSFKNKGYLAGDDVLRAEELQKALTEEETSAVWCIRGGYGSARLLPRLDLVNLRKRPKILIGFSDVTAILLALSSKAGYVTFHGPVVTQLVDVPKTGLDWLTRMLENPVPVGNLPLGRLKTIVKGSVEGFLMGGNMSVLVSMIGTPFFPSLAGSILCIEDIGEKAYRLDRMFWQLKEAGVLKEVLGFVIGSLSGCIPSGRTRYSARRVLEEAVSKLGVPSVSGASFGHIARNITLPMGIKARLDADMAKITILESCVL